MVRLAGLFVALVATVLVPDSSSAAAPTGACVPAKAPSSVWGMSVTGPDAVWITGSGSALRHTVDGGRTWAAPCLPAEAVGERTDFWDVEFLPDGSTGWVTASVSEEGSRRFLILRTVDGGRTWSTANVPGFGGALYDVAFTDARIGWAVGKSYTSEKDRSYPTDKPLLLSTSDGGATWIHRPLPPTQGDMLRAVSFSDRRHGWLVGRDVLLSTSDGGTTWEPVPSPEGPEVRDLYWEAVAFKDSRHGWIAGGRFTRREFSQPRLAGTSDRGATWSNQLTFSGNIPVFLSLHIAPDGAVYATGNDGGVHITRDDGETWSEFVRLNAGEVRGIRFLDANVGWAAIAGHEPRAQVCVTRDGGRTWTGYSVEGGDPIDCH